MELALRAYMAAGAEAVTLPHAFGHLTARREDGPEAFEAMIREARRGGVALHDMPMLSAHQMGSCRMGASPRCAAVFSLGLARLGGRSCLFVTCFCLGARAADALSPAPSPPPATNMKQPNTKNSDSACDADGQVWDAAGLYIADASAFPTASGVNPMITAMAIAHLVSSGIAQRVAAARKAAKAPAGAPRIAVDVGAGGAPRAPSDGGSTPSTASTCEAAPLTPSSAASGSGSGAGGCGSCSPLTRSSHSSLE